MFSKMSIKVDDPAYIFINENTFHQLVTDITSYITSTYHVDNFFHAALSKTVNKEGAVKAKNYTDAMARIFGINLQDSTDTEQIKAIFQYIIENMELLTYVPGTQTRRNLKRIRAKTASDFGIQFRNLTDIPRSEFTAYGLTAQEIDGLDAENIAIYVDVDNRAIIRLPDIFEMPTDDTRRDIATAFDRFANRLKKLGYVRSQGNGEPYSNDQRLIGEVARANGPYDRVVAEIGRQRQPKSAANVAEAAKVKSQIPREQIEETHPFPFF